MPNGIDAPGQTSPKLSVPEIQLSSMKKIQTWVLTNERVDKLGPVNRFIMDSIFDCSSNSFLLLGIRLGLRNSCEGCTQHERQKQGGKSEEHHRKDDA